MCVEVGGGDHIVFNKILVEGESFGIDGRPIVLNFGFMHLFVQRMYTCGRRPYQDIGNVPIGPWTIGSGELVYDEPLDGLASQRKTNVIVQPCVHRAEHI